MGGNVNIGGSVTVSYYRQEMVFWLFCRASHKQVDWNLEQCQDVLLVFVCLFVFQKGSHVYQGKFEFWVWLRMTLNLRFFFHTLYLPVLYRCVPHVQFT